MNQPSSPSKAAPFPWRRLRTDFAYACCLNLICAVVLTFLVNDGTDFFSNLVGSMCVGSIVFLVIDLGRLGIWGEHRRPRLPAFAGLVLLGAAMGQLLGQALFRSIMGMRLLDRGDLADSRMLGALIFTLTAAGAGTLFFHHRERIARLEASSAEEKAKTEQVARQAMQAQLQMLQAQIEPHMLFNTLANLQGLIGLDPERAGILLDQLIHYLRATLSSSRAATTTLKQEFALMEAYLGLMSVRMGPRLRYTLDLPEALGALAVPPMLLQPLLENAIQHGLEPKIDGGHIAIDARTDGGNLIVTVADSGLGLDQLHPKHGTGLGVANIHARLHAMHAERAALSLSAGTPCGTIARLTLPMSPL